MADVDEKVERVARAIYEDFRKGRGEGRLPAWENLGPGDYDSKIRAMYFSRARAAIAALPSEAARERVLEGALRGVFSRLDHPGNGGQHVNYFLRWPEVEAARAALQEPTHGRD